jgi:cytochrome P450
MLVEMRKIALLILIETLFKVDFTPDMRRLWQSILKTIQYISPGVWLISRHIPRFGYAGALERMDEYLYRLIRLRRQHIGDDDDLLGLLVSTQELDDHLIRDQLLTMLIAGHDTSTALLSWALYLLGQHPEIMRCAQQEVNRVLGEGLPTVENTTGLRYLDQIIDESLRLYPPIHLGSRVAAIDLDFQGYTIPAGARVMYSIYLTHRLPQYWENPHTFDPDRFSSENSKNRVPYTFLPFGGGPRNCIGAAFAQVESRIVLSRIFQLFDLELVKRRVHAHMGATLEPRPGVSMKVRRR